MSIWKHFLIGLVILTAYQMLWRFSFDHLFATYEAAGSVYPVMLYFKLLSELLIYGLAAPWLFLAYDNSALLSRLLCGGCAIISAVLTLLGLTQLMQ